MQLLSLADIIYFLFHWIIVDVIVISILITVFLMIKAILMVLMLKWIRFCRRMHISNKFMDIRMYLMRILRLIWRIMLVAFVIWVLATSAGLSSVFIFRIAFFVISHQIYFFRFRFFIQLSCLLKSFRFFSWCWQIYAVNEKFSDFLMIRWAEVVFLLISLCFVRLIRLIVGNIFFRVLNLLNINFERLTIRHLARFSHTFSGFISFFYRLIMDIIF